MSQPSSLDSFFDDALRRSLDEHDRNLWSAIWDQASGGKRFRPRLLLAMYAALGGEDEHLATAAADAVALLHTAFVIHDDVIDGDEIRRGRPNVLGQFSAYADSAGASPERAKRYGESAGILAGDLALLGALRVIATSGASRSVLNRLIHLLDDVLRRSAAGELADVRVSFTGATLEEIIDIAAWKTSAYSFELPLQAAAILAGAGEDIVAGLGRAGRSLGIAFQLLDDIDGVFAPADQTGKDPLSDLREGKFTGLMAFARDSEQWEELSRCVGRSELTAEEAVRARCLLIESGARDSVTALAQEYREAALAEAMSLPKAAGDVVRKAIALILPGESGVRSVGVA